MINVNDFKGLNDNEVIEAAIANRDADGIVFIPPRISDIEPERDYWLLDRAILLPENTTVIMQNSKIKLSDKCRDNFFRTANCGLGIEFPERIHNVHLEGKGLCILEGADHPRATGDSSKILACPCPYEVGDLCAMADWIPEERRTPETIDFWDRHDHSYGTDAGKEGESQYGDWRGIGVLFANTENFSIKNIRIVCTHGWGISLEECAFGSIEKIHFDSCMSKVIDGMRQNIENQDGLDIRNGCHDIIISDITGQTGDDVVALTACTGDKYIPGGSLNSTHVMHSDWTRRDKNIHNIVIKNVVANSNLCYIVRLLPGNTKIWNVVIDGIIDTATEEQIHSGTIIMGAAEYGEHTKDGLSAITVSNVICKSNKAIIVSEYLKDSVITNVVNKNPNTEAVKVLKDDGLINVKMENIITVGR